MGSQFWDLEFTAASVVLQFVVVNPYPASQEAGFSFYSLFGNLGPMIELLAKIRIPAYFLILSLLFHILFLYGVRMCGNYVFSPPVTPLQSVMVELQKPAVQALAPAIPNGRSNSHAPGKAEGLSSKNETPPPPAREETSSKPPAGQDERQPMPVPEQPAASLVDKPAIDNKPRDTAPKTARQTIAQPIKILPPLRSAGEFLSSRTEKLSYQISLLGIPVGSAELEAKNDNGQVNITLAVRSNATMASVYPVNDLVETRHIAGNFVITNVRQQEGSLRSDIGFTIFLRDRKVFWYDRIRSRHSRETIPSGEVLDTLSAFYFLRNRVLKVDKAETLHIYDGDAYAPILVEVVRRETIRLANLKKVDTLVVHPVRENGATFRKSGDMLLWLTNDDNRVPVKAEMALPVGTVTAELVSSEVQQWQDVKEVKKPDVN